MIVSFFKNKSYSFIDKPSKMAKFNGIKDFGFAFLMLTVTCKSFKSDIFALGKNC